LHKAGKAPSAHYASQNVKEGFLASHLLAKWMKLNLLTDFIDKLRLPAFMMECGESSYAAAKKAAASLWAAADGLFFFMTRYAESVAVCVTLNGGRCFLWDILLGFLDRDGKAKSPRAGTGIEECAEQDGFEDVVEAGGELPVRHQYEGRKHIHHRSSNGDQGKYKAGGACLTGCRHFGIVEKEEDQRADGDVAERMIEILVIVGGIGVGGDQEHDCPDCRENGELFFRFRESRVACRVEDEVDGTGEEKNIGSETGIFEERIFSVGEDRRQIEGHENGDRDENEAEQGACENGGLVVRNGERPEFAADHEKG